jgi:hypothetical protein
MQDHPLDHSGAAAPDVVEHLDLVTAELRRRIAGIGLAIAELREETGRLRASADARYPAVAVLDRPPDVGAAAAVDELHVAPHVAPQPQVIEPMPPVVGHPVSGGVPFEPRIAEPVAPWSVAPVVAAEPTPRPAGAAAPVVADHVQTVDAGVQPAATAPTLTWVPEPEPAPAFAPTPVVEAIAAPAAVAPAPVVEVSTADVAVRVERAGAAEAEVAPVPLWNDGDDEDSAAFEAFFSAEIEPEPSQRWLLSD